MNDSLWQQRGPARPVVWTLGCLLLLAGGYLLLLAGGMSTLADYNRQAARGDSPLPLLEMEADAVVVAAPLPAVVATSTPAPTWWFGRALARVPTSSATPPPPPAAISRLVIPAIEVDTKVVSVGWVTEAQGDETQTVWQVADYAAGHHIGTAFPGQGGNIVLSGHVGGEGRVFRNLYAVSPGHRVVLYQQDTPHPRVYVIQERVLVDEEGAAPVRRAANLRYLASTDDEVVTLISCWPPDGPDRYTQRIIVRAVPLVARR